MLPSFVTNLLWGTPAEEDGPREVEHSTSEEAGDWLLVTCQRAASGCAVSTGHDSRLTSDYDECDAQSVVSDGSWVITPAVTFGGTAPCEATDPLEDLLIEHPTMSIYHSTGNRDAKHPNKEASNAQVNSSEENSTNHIRELVLMRNRHIHQLATQLQIPSAIDHGYSKKSQNKNTPPRLTRRALRRHNANKVKPSKIQKCSFKAGKRRS